jgi:hypothetical protein
VTLDLAARQGRAQRSCLSQRAKEKSDEKIRKKELETQNEWTREKSMVPHCYCYILKKRKKSIFDPPTFASV